MRFVLYPDLCQETPARSLIAYGDDRLRFGCSQMQASPALSGHPLADVCRAVLERDAVRFAPHEKVDCVHTDQGQILQVQYYAATACFTADQRFQLRQVVFYHSTAESKDHPVVRRSSNPQHGDLSGCNWESTCNLLTTHGLTNSAIARFSSIGECRAKSPNEKWLERMASGKNARRVWSDSCWSSAAWSLIPA